MSVLLKKNSNADIGEAWALDKLNRKEIGQYLTPIVGSIRQPFVISLNSNYGTGKTFFIRNWSKQLAGDGYKTVCFNAWESDYSNNPLLAFIGSIKEQLSEISGITGDVVVERALTKFSNLAKASAPIILKGLFRKAIGAEAVEKLADFSEKTDEEVASILGKYAETALKEHTSLSSSIAAFKDCLSDFIEDISSDEPDEDKKKLIIFVDELDRCRPTYAVEVLECIKHLFQVDGVVFILAIDEKHLRNAIASVYGSDLDGEGYLKKFIDWRLNLPAPSAVQYAQYLYEDYAFDEVGCFTPDSNLTTGKERFCLVFGVMAEAYGLSLREQAQLFTEINLVVRSLESNEPPYVFLVAVIAVLKFKEAEKLQLCITDDLQPYEFVSEIRNKIGKKKLETYFERWEAGFRYYLHAAFIYESPDSSFFRELWELEDMRRNAEERGEVLPDEEKRKLQYKQKVDTEYCQMRQHIGVTKPIAEIVLDRFEVAAKLAS